MTRSQRRRISRQRARQYSHSPGDFRPAPSYMAQTELRRQHVARQVAPTEPTHIDGRHYDPRETAYSPLTVSTLFRDSRGRRYPANRSSSYSRYTV